MITLNSKRKSKMKKMWTSTYDMMIIDAYTIFGSFYPFRKIDISVDTLKRQLLKYNVYKAFTISARAFLYDYLEGNEETLLTCKASDTFFLPTATIHPGKCLNPKRDVRRIARQGFKILRLFPEYQKFDLDQIHVLNILRELEKSKIPTIISSAVGLTKIGRVSRRFTDLKIIVSDVTFDAFPELIAVMNRCGNIYLIPNFLFSPNLIKKVVEEGWSKRIIFGSNAPLKYVGSALNLIKYADVNDTDKKRILCENIKELTGMNL